MSSAPGSSSLTGFTRLCKGLSVVLVAGHVLVEIFPTSVTFLALIPARTIPFAWNLLTAGYLEQTVFGAIISTVGLLFMGKVLEPIWGTREFLKFIFIINFLTFVCVFITAITAYYVTALETYLYLPISGFYGVLVGLLVGIKQIVPDQDLPLLRIKAKWLPSLVLLLCIAISFFVAEVGSYLPVIVFGIYMSWIYLRFLQKKPETNFRGDPSDDFSFSSFFPEILRPVIDPFASLVARLLLGRSGVPHDVQNYSYGDAPLPVSDSIEATRRRERGARALEERLAAEKLVAGRKAADSSKDAAEIV